MTTTRLFSLDSLRALASSSRRGHLAGGTGNLATSWLVADRDLDRVAAGLLAVAQADPERLSATAPAVAAPVDLGSRRARSATSSSTSQPTAPHARAS